MDLLQNEKCIETEQLNITGNIMTWQGKMVQLSNVSYITTQKLSPVKLPWSALVLIGLGICMFAFKAVVAFVMIVLGGIIFYTWYADNKKRSQSMMLTICMNSGKNLQILFINKDFLNRVLSVLEKIIIDGGIGNQNISIDLSGSQFAGDAQVLNNLGINQK